MKYEFIHRHRCSFAVEKMCRVLEVSRGGYYGWLCRGPSRRQRENDRLLEHIRQSYKRGRGKYGSPRITDDLRGRDIMCGRHRVARLMRKNGITAKKRRKHKVTTNSKHKLPLAENLLGRDFKALAPDRVWVSDITYVWTLEGWLYLAVVLDLFSRQVVGWAMSERLGTELAVGALRQALARRRPPEGLVFHSDRGVQYASRALRDVLKGAGIRQSMSRKGDCWDNAVAESFFATLKTELVYEQRYLTRAGARRSIFEYIEVFYNRQRLHSALGNLSPADFESAVMAA